MPQEVTTAIIKHLIVDQFGTHVGKHSGRLRVTRIKTNEKVAEAPLLHLDAVLIASRGVSISADAVRECAERGIPIFFLSGTGTPYASLYSSHLTGTIATRRAQLSAYEDGRGVVVARAITLGKILNQVNVLRYLSKNRKDAEPEIFNSVQERVLALLDVASELEHIEAERIEDIRDRILGAEGQAAQVYWQGIKQLLRQDLDWPGRRTRGARDVFNQALNYGYGVLYGQVERALVLAGLDPYAGFLHADRPGKPSLVLDLVEEFRQQVVDRPLVGLVNRKVSLQQEKEGRLGVKTRRTVAERVLKRLEGQVRYEGKRVGLRVVLQSQARHLATFLRGERETYEPFVGSW